MPAIISGESGGKSGKLRSNTVSCGVYRENCLCNGPRLVIVCSTRYSA